jgi:hypothetical protein
MDARGKEYALETLADSSWKMFEAHRDIDLLRKLILPDSRKDTAEPFWDLTLVSIHPLWLSSLTVGQERE